MEEGKQRISKAQEAELKHKSRRLSIKEGIFWSLRSSFGDQYIAPFAIFTGMTNSLVTVLNSTWNIGPISQLFGAKRIGKQSRKSILTRTVSIDAIGWLFMAIIAIMYLKNIATEILPYLIIADLSLILIAGGFGHPAWFSWIGDIVDSKFRGRWTSKRSTIISFTTMVVAISLSFVLKYFKEIGKENIAFIAFFTIAFLARLYCAFILKRQYEPELKVKKQKKFTLIHFIKEAKKTNLGKFTLFRGMFAMIIGLTSPLVSIYLLRHLGFDYVSYMIVTLSGTIFSVLTLNLWGRIADKYGSYKVIALTTLIIPLTPLLWILSPSKIYLFLIPSILGGTSWSAFVMASGNFIYDNTSKDIRGKAISYFNLFTGMGALIGGLISAFLIGTIKPLSINFSFVNGATNPIIIEPLFLIFIIGTILRMLVVGFWIPKLNEVEKKKKMKGLGELKRLVIKEIIPTLSEDIHEITAIPKYIKE